MARKYPTQNNHMYTPTRHLLSHNFHLHKFHNLNCFRNTQPKRYYLLQDMLAVVAVVEAEAEAEEVEEVAVVEEAQSNNSYLRW